jgi:hypothetical protein
MLTGKATVLVAGIFNLITRKSPKVRDGLPGAVS